MVASRDRGEGRADSAIAAPTAAAADVALVAGAVEDNSRRARGVSSFSSPSAETAAAAAAAICLFEWEHRPEVVDGYAVARRPGPNARERHAAQTLLLLSPLLVLLVLPLRGGLLPLPLPLPLLLLSALLLLLLLLEEQSVELPPVLNAPPADAVTTSVLHAAGAITCPFCHRGRRSHRRRKGLDATAAAGARGRGRQGASPPVRTQFCDQ